MTEPQGPARPPGSEQGLVSREALSELAAVYRELDQHLAGLGVECRACGRCCDFRQNDYRLYASFLERAAILQGHGRPRLTASGHCGFLVGGRCAARAWRPLACRVFFCAPAHKAREPELCQAFQHRLRATTDGHGLPWDYAPFFGEEGPKG